MALADRYRIEREIGRGGMATVYLAYDLKHRRQVALKVLRPELAASVAPRRFHREVTIAANLQHPHILPLFDSGEADGSLYYVMPFVDGETLRDRMVRERRFGVAEAVRLTSLICDALAYAHAQGVVHRDVKPENILLREGHPYVADFGIARSLDSGEFTGTTDSAITAIGTLAYMSPEQARGGQAIDAASDIYSLGCVLFEMLAGEAPFAGSTPQAMLALRRHTTPPPVSELRPDVPAGVVRALQRALAVDPRQRFASATDFAEELKRGLEQSGAPRRLTLRRVAVMAAPAAAAVVLVVTLLPRPPAATAGLAVLPLLHSDSVPELALDGDQCARLLYDAFSRWSGIALINDMVVRDARSRHGGQVGSLSAATAIGHDLGARYVVWGEVTSAARGVTVNTTLFDIAGRVNGVRRRAVFIEAGESVEAAFAALADSLLLGILPRNVPPAAIAGTRNFDALRAYAAAHSALDAWDLAAAESLFRAATGADRNYAAAQLELAQVIAWRNGSPDEWRPAALQARALRAQLGERQRQLADALLAIADDEHQRACDTYRALVRRDSLDFDAWFGLGECQSRDRRVLRDGASRSGWRFRSSQDAAIDAYRRALELAPLFQRALTSTAYDRVALLLFTEVGQLRTGSAVAPESGAFAAYPELAGDSLAFVPYPVDSVYAGAPGTYPATHIPAVDRNRRLLRDLARRWVAAAPRDARAHEIFAASLESLVELGPAVPADTSGEDALSEIQAVRRLATDSTAQIRAAALQVRLLVKAGQPEAAAGLADSLLANRLAPRGVARYLAGVAALVGRTTTAARWARRATEELADLRPAPDPPLLFEPTRDAAALLVFAANGTEPDSVRRLLVQVDEKLAAVSSSAQRSATRRNLLDWPVTLAYPQLGLSSLHRKAAGGNAQMEVEWEMAHGDTAAARRTLAALRAFGERERPGDAGFDAIVLEAELRLALGDSAAASDLLAQTLGATESSGRQLVEGLAESAGFGRALALGAQLAERRGEPAIARRWAQTYVTLLGSAEGNSRDVLRSMRDIAARP